MEGFNLMVGSKNPVTISKCNGVIVLNEPEFKLCSLKVQ